MAFIKFPSIKNAYDMGTIEKFQNVFPELQNYEYIVTEKLDGANFQIGITENNLEFGSRNQKLIMTSSFFDFQKIIVNDCSEQISKIQRYVLETDGIDIIHVYGELYGNGIQKRVFYGNERYFTPFEIRINNSIISIKEALELFVKLDINWWVPILGIYNSLPEALNFEVENRTTNIGDRTLDSADRFIEGVVIAPFDKVLSRKLTENQEEFFRLKKKSVNFSDRSPKHNTQPIEEDLDNDLIDVVRTYYTRNRLLDLFSKEGIIKDNSEIGKFIKLLNADVFNDFLEHNKEDFCTASEATKKRINSLSGKYASQLILEYLSLYK